MQRIVEQPAGDGEVFSSGVRVGTVRYHLAVYQHFSEHEGESVPANLEVEGRVTAIDGVDVAECHRSGVELTLQLVDGRRLDLLIIDEHGAIRSTGRSLYDPEDRA
jgi:hypothetical protein